MPFATQGQARKCQGRWGCRRTGANREQGLTEVFMGEGMGEEGGERVGGCP